MSYTLSYYVIVDMNSCGPGSEVLDNSLIRDAQSHLNQAKSIDPSNTVAEAFLQKVRIYPLLDIYP